MPRVTPPSPRSGFVEPCLPSSAERPPSGPGCVHEIKLDVFRLMARRDAEVEKIKYPGLKLSTP